MSKERQAKEAAQIFRLLRAFRSIRDRAVRRHVIEAVAAMADRREAPDDKADTVTSRTTKIEPPSGQNAAMKANNDRDVGSGEAARSRPG